MTTKQNDAAAMTQEQLAGVSGGPHYTNWFGVTAAIQQRRSNRTRYTEMDETEKAVTCTSGGTY
jgi:hypothetical protein